MDRCVVDEHSIDLEAFGPDPSSRAGHAGCAACGHVLSGQEESAADAGRAVTTAVRFGFLRYLGQFTHSEELRFTSGARVVIQTMRGIEIGQQVPLTCSGCARAVTGERLQAWVDTCSEGSMIFGAGRILREATAADLAEFAHIQGLAPERRAFCQRLADRHELTLKVVDCETLFGGERIIFYFTAAERVDFRGLVRELAKEYRTRIEMRQVGARDEARLLADYETCGREVCCKVFLKTLKQINMKMAKVQKATLDPSQVSGRCGRLKCCLRFEHEEYEALDKSLPRVGARINSNHGEGVVVSRQILTQLVQIRTDADRVIAVAVEDILPPGVKPKKVEVPVERKPRGRAEGSSGGRPPADGERKRSSRRRTRRPSKTRRSGTGDKGSSGREGSGGEADGNRKPVEPGKGSAPAPSQGEGGDSPGRPPRSNRRRRKPRGRRGRGGSGQPRKPADGGDAGGPKDK